VVDDGKKLTPNPLSPSTISTSWLPNTCPSGEMVNARRDWWWMGLKRVWLKVGERW